MSAHAPNHDDALFDRLVDGELSFAEREQLLASLDDRPDGWRRLRAGVSRSSILRGAMHRMVSEPASAGRMTALPAPSGRSRWTSHAGAWLAAAAAVLVAFGAGWRMNGPRRPDASTLAASSPTDVQAVDDPAAADHLPAGPNPDAITLVVQDRNGLPRRVQVPLVDGSELGGQFDQTPAWLDAAARQQLADQGLDLRGRRRYAPLYFQQADKIVPMMVPVDDAVITPVSRTVY